VACSPGRGSGNLGNLLYLDLSEIRLPRLQGEASCHRGELVSGTYTVGAEALLEDASYGGHEAGSSAIQFSKSERRTVATRSMLPS